MIVNGWYAKCASAQCENATVISGCLLVVVYGTIHYLYHSPHQIIIHLWYHSSAHGHAHAE